MYIIRNNGEGVSINIPLGINKTIFFPENGVIKTNNKDLMYWIANEAEVSVKVRDAFPGEVETNLVDFQREEERKVELEEKADLAELEYLINWIGVKASISILKKEIYQS